MNTLSWRLLLRELRAGELRLLLGALTIAVAAVCAVGFFTQRVHRALEGEAAQLVGGDLVLVSDHPWAGEVIAEAGRRGLVQARTLVFPSMVQAGGNFSLAEIKAVSSNYPLRGRLVAAATPDSSGQAVDAGPAPGCVWPDERLANALKIRPGDPLQVGKRLLRVTAILVREPDRGVNVFNFAPRLLMHVDDLPASGLLGPGARISDRQLLGGGQDGIEDFRQWLTPRLERGQRLEDAGNARPEVRTALDRAERFLGLAAVLAVVLAAVAMALATRRYMQRQLDACAVMRCLGCTQGRLLRLHLALFVWLALFAALLGGVLGFAVHYALLGGLSGWLDLNLPSPGLQPMLLGIAVAGVLLFGFALPPLLQLADVSTLRVLRRELGVPAGSALGGRMLGLLALAGLMLAAAGEMKLGLMVMAGFALAALLFLSAAWGAVSLLIRVRARGGFAWRQGLTSLGRHRQASILQITSLAVAFMALLLLTVTRSELLDAWQGSLPPDAPNRFAINLQPEQRLPFGERLAQAGIAAELSPMVRARLLQINGKAVSASAYPDDERAQRLVEREFNLSWRADLPSGNRIVGGDWFPPGSSGQPLASVEAGLAKTLGIAVGDEIVFAVAGEQKRLRVSSLRRLEWDSLRVNFFVLVPPGVIEEAPASYITSFRLDNAHAALGGELVQAFPNLTLIDIAEVLEQLKQLIAQVAGAVQLVFLFTLAAGIVVLLAALFSAFDERRYEFALMRALGASRQSLLQALFVELAAIGGSAGLIAALGAAALGQLVGRQIFEIAPPVDFFLPVLAAGGGALLTSVVGWLALRRLLDIPPWPTLRAGG